MLETNIDSAVNKAGVLSLAIGKPLQECFEDQTLWPQSKRELLEQFLDKALEQQQTESYFVDLNIQLLVQLQKLAK